MGRPDPDPTEAIRRERDEAVAYARAIEHELGRARGRIKRLERALWRRTARRRRVEAMTRRLGSMLRR